MAHYCGRCGSSLEATALRAGRCPVCGMEVAVSGDELDSNDTPSAEVPTQLTALAPVAAADAADTHPSNAHTTPARQAINRNARRQGARRVPALWAFALLSAVVLLLAGAAIFALAQRGTLSVIFMPSISSNAHASSRSSSSISGGGAATASATFTAPGSGGAPAPGASPSPSNSPTASPTATLSIAPTATPTPPALSVSPTSFTFPLCLEAQATFTVANIGGTTMSWNTSSANSYKVNPGSGSIDAGGQEKVTVSNILLSSVIVTITAPGALNSPQQVTITCTL